MLATTEILSAKNDVQKSNNFNSGCSLSCLIWQLRVCTYTGRMVTSSLCSLSWNLSRTLSIEPVCSELLVRDCLSLSRFVASFKCINISHQLLSIIRIASSSEQSYRKQLAKFPVIKIDWVYKREINKQQQNIGLLISYPVQLTLQVVLFSRDIIHNRRIVSS